MALRIRIQHFRSLQPSSHPVRMAHQQGGRVPRGSLSGFSGNIIRHCPKKAGHPTFPHLSSFRPVRLHPLFPQSLSDPCHGFFIRHGQSGTRPALRHLGQSCRLISRPHYCMDLTTLQPGFPFCPEFGTQPPHLVKPLLLTFGRKHQHLRRLGKPLQYFHKDRPDLDNTRQYDLNLLWGSLLGQNSPSLRRIHPTRFSENVSDLSKNLLQQFPSLRLCFRCIGHLFRHHPGDFCKAHPLPTQFIPQSQQTLSE